MGNQEVIKEQRERARILNKIPEMFKFNRRSSLTQKPLFLEHTTATLVNGNFKKLCACPKYVELDEWLACHTFEFFNYINLFYGAISDYCTPKDCPAMTMNAGCDYYWIDSSKRTVKVSAPQYVDYVMTWIQNVMEDEGVFPTKAGNESFYQCLFDRWILSKGFYNAYKTNL
jgi:hypothetical protein